MPELTPEMSVFITTSYQAMLRAKLTDKPPDLLVMMLFAGIYVEGNVRAIAELLDLTELMEKQTSDRAGMERRASWLYGHFAEVEMSSDWRERMDTLEAAFPGIEEIMKFRNEVAHGILVSSKLDIDYASDLRQTAKDIVQQFIDMALERGEHLDRLYNYRQALAKLDEENVDE